MIRFRDSHRTPSGPDIGLRLLLGVAAIALFASAFSTEAAEKFKPFELKTPEGVTRTLDDFPGKAILVGFFFPSCPYCNAAYPEIARIYETYRDQGLAMVWINVVDEEEPEVKTWSEKNRNVIPVLVGASQRKLQRDYKIRMTPEHVLLNPERQILFRQRGYESGYETELEDRIREALE